VVHEITSSVAVVPANLTSGAVYATRNYFLNSVSIIFVHKERGKQDRI
jgi:hypothetical protein